MPELPVAPTPPWTSPDASYAPLRGEADADVVVVGAGIAGLTTAVLLARSGARVRVLEAGRVGQGTTGGSTAKVSVLQGFRLSTLADAHARPVVEAYVAAQLEAQRWLEARALEREVDCQLARRDAVSYTDDPAEVAKVETEAALLRDAGIDADVLDEDPELPYPIAAAVRVADQVQIDPRAWVADLAAEVDATDGCAVHEHSRVVDLADRGRVAATPEGRVRARDVVIATLLPTVHRGLFYARSEPLMSHGIAVVPDADPPQSMYLGSGSGTRSLRTATGPDGRDLLLVGGEGHTVGRRAPTSECQEELARWAQRWFGATDVVHRWAAHDYESIDHLPYVGRADRLPGAPWVATGFAKWGMTNGTASALTIAAALGGDEPKSDRPWDAVFDPRRVEGWEGLREAARVNAGVAGHLAAGWVRPPRPTEGPATGRRGAVPTARCGTPPAGSPSGIARAEGGAAGSDCHLALVCTHLGGVLRWNDAERTWDCPLHGSRFADDGTVVTGPATRALRRVD